MKKALSSLVLVVAFAGALLASYNLGFLHLNYPSDRSFPIKGIDVSHHQGSIEWEHLIDESEIAFAFIKASEGSSLQDPRFHENWKASDAIARGSYHFFTFCADGRAQAKNFLTVAPSSSELPPAVDVEFEGNCRSWSSIQNIRSDLEEFLTDITEAGHQAPILYVNRKSFARIIRGHFDSYPLWVRETVVHPPDDVYPRWVFWQYAGNGRLEGVDTRVDLNAFRGSRKQFAQAIESRFEHVP